MTVRRDPLWSLETTTDVGTGHHTRELTIDGLPLTIIHTYTHTHTHTHMRRLLIKHHGYTTNSEHEGNTTVRVLHRERGAEINCYESIKNSLKLQLREFRRGCPGNKNTRTNVHLRSTSELTAIRQAPFSLAALGLSVWLSKLLHLGHLGGGGGWGNIGTDN